VTLMALIGVAIIANIMALFMLSYFGYYLLNGALVCSPPDGYSEQYYREQIYRSNQFYLTDG
jgi:hypothetical protein